MNPKTCFGCGSEFHGGTSSPMGDGTSMGQCCWPSFVAHPTYARFREAQDRSQRARAAHALLDWRRERRAA